MYSKLIENTERKKNMPILSMIKKAKEKKEEKRRAAEKAEAERKFKEKSLVKKTLRSLKNTVDKYEGQKQIFIKLAREAEARGLMPQYNMAANGLKIVIESQDKAKAMYLNLTISNQIKEMCNDTKMFVDSMSTISKQLSEIQAGIDFVQAQADYNYAMLNINKTEEKLKDFSDNIYDSISSFVENDDQDSKIDEAISALIHGASENIDLPSVETVDNSDIDRKIRELGGLLNECK